MPIRIASACGPIGYGHTEGVKKGDRITLYQAEKFLKDDLAKFEPVANKCKRIATQGQYDAVLDFIYNCGPKNWESSTLKKYIEGSHKTWEIQEQFLRLGECRWQEARWLGVASHLGGSTL